MDVILAVIAALTFVKVGALEIELLSAVKGPPENYRLRLIQNLEGEGYFFMSGSKSVSAPNDMIAEIIANVESHPQFFISAIFFRVPGSQGALFSITHNRRKNLILMEITVKGFGDRTRLILQYRAINGSTTELVFPGLSVLSNDRWHSLLIHVYSDSFDTSGIDLYIDCKKVARKQTVSPLSMIFSYRGIRLSRMEMRVGSRHEKGRKKLFWKGGMQSVKFVFKRKLGEYLHHFTCEKYSSGRLKQPSDQIQVSKIDMQMMAIPAMKELAGLVRDLRYDMAMQTMEIKYLRQLVEGCQMCRVQDYCKLKPCFPGVPCFNDPSSLAGFECGTCPLGMEGNGINCTDIDECKVNPCSDFTECRNRNPGYTCTICPPGYKGAAVHGVGLRFAERNKQVCEDIDECKEDSSACDKHSNCTNTIGSYSCSDCPIGYIGDPKIACIFLNFCDKRDPRSNPCHKRADCTALRGGRNFHCQCHVGWAGNGLLCERDSDFDGFPDYGLNCTEKKCKKDNCPAEANPDQSDIDKDGIGDICDEDMDGDGFPNTRDNCPRNSNPLQENSDTDQFGDVCDNCPYVSNPLQSDMNDDDEGDVCDNDIDGDGIPNARDSCPKFVNPIQTDSDGDGVGDLCDNCVTVRNARQFDRDYDLLGDACDRNRDKDSDGVDDSIDNCQTVVNPDQRDNDKDGKGDACDPDDDNDGIPDTKDNCPLVANGVIHRDLDGDGIGDKCYKDLDGDGVENLEDACPLNRNVKRTDFTRIQFVIVNPYQRPSINPIWVIDKKGTQVKQLENSDAGMAIGEQRFEGVDWNGTLYIDHRNDDDYVGLIFGFQNAKNFYAVLWKRRRQILWITDPFRSSATANLHIKRVQSKRGPGPLLRSVLWHSQSYEDETQVLWKDAYSRGWQPFRNYHWRLIHRPKAGLIRLVVYEDQYLFVDSGYIRDATLPGGRLGFFVYSQPNVIWKNLSYRCNDEVPEDSIKTN